MSDLQAARAAARRLLALGLAVATGAAGAQAPQQVDYILVRKAARTMTLYAAGRPVRTITGIQLGGEPVGAKHFQGDRRTPEGRYTVDYGNPASAYDLSLHISYPNADDVAYAAAYGRSPGGLVFIHGQPGDWPGTARGARVPGDWTDGCIAVSDAEVEALWQEVPDGAVIDIVP